MSFEASTQNATHLTWIKSSHSSEEGGECVEVAMGPEAVYIRDSKARSGPALALDPRTWAAFVRFAARD